jgi:protein-disulfide isomerase
MRGVLVAVILGCIVLIGGAALFSVSNRGGSARLIPINDAYTKRVDTGYWQKGSTNPKVILTEYVDFQDAAALTAQRVVDGALQQVGDITQLRVKMYPGTRGHANSLGAAKAAEAVGRQGKFWDMYNILLVSQASWQNATVDNAQTLFESYAKSLNLNMPQYRADVQDSSISDPIDHDGIVANRIPVTSTFLFNDSLVNGFPINSDALAQYLKDHQITPQPTL